MSRFPKSLIGMQKPDFQKVFSDNQRSGDSMLLVLARPNGLERSRLGLAIAKKHTPGAVQRNRIKRIVRESFMLNQPFSRPVDTVVLNRPGISQQTNQKLFQSLENHWKNINQRLEEQGAS